MPTTNSRISRVQPVFSWLIEHDPNEWPQSLVNLADGLAHRSECGPVEHIYLNPEMKVPPTAARLAWMIRNVQHLTPLDGKSWRQLPGRVANPVKTARALALLDSGQTDSLPRGFALEGETCADCLIECEKSIIWIEGKRFDWLSPSTKWDVTRDQLARNIEAVWSLASKVGKDYCLLICHEHPFKHHEELLLRGYRTGSWVGGLPHVPEDIRQEFGRRIGTVRWKSMTSTWPALRDLPELFDLGAPLP
jgi:hypothetical protein